MQNHKFEFSGLMLAMQHGLLGAITPALRAVSIERNAEGNWTFSDFQIDSRITRLDFPQWVDRGEKWIAYLRKEDMPD